MFPFSLAKFILVSSNSGCIQHVWTHATAEDKPCTMLFHVTNYQQVENNFNFMDVILGIFSLSFGCFSSQLHVGKTDLEGASFPS